uniref:Uncharacterized protein n=1 Tax=Arundo donax TaxID=35708 RepID=A0A0A9A5E1_ARUDO
MFLWIGVG